MKWNIEEDCLRIEERWWNRYGKEVWEDLWSEYKVRIYGMEGKYEGEFDRLG